MEVVKELFETVEQRFDHHLSLDNNHRILLSGRFGIGKTTFLKYFFGKNADRFNALHLSPVNYSILGNEDVFSYLKYDILLELFSNHEYPLKEDYYSFLKTWDDFLLANLDQIIATTMLLIPKLGKQLNQFTKELSQLRKAFKEYQRSEEQKEKDEIINYLMTFHQSEGGIYETNIITLLIQEWLNDIKDSGRQNILIVDDLDRIDPSHIFRLLNVFSAHFDARDVDPGKNKFGFDQVILVCDLENVRNIYQQQFGARTDFNGYIDKFYSLEVFRHDNKEIILSILDGVVNSIRFDYLKQGERLEHPGFKRMRETVKIILRPLILRDHLNLRSLFKFYKKSILIPEIGISHADQSILVHENYFLSGIHILSAIVGDFQILRGKIEVLETLKVTYSDNPPILIGDVIFLKYFSTTSVVTGLRGFTMDKLEYDFTFGDSNFKGTYQVFGPRDRGEICYVGLVSSLEIDGEEIDHRASRGEEIEYIHFLKEGLELVKGPNYR